MEMPMLLYIMVLLSSCPWQLHAQENSTDPDMPSDMFTMTTDASVDTEVAHSTGSVPKEMLSTELQTNTAPVATDIDSGPVTIPPEGTSEANLVPQTSFAHKPLSTSLYTTGDFTYQVTASESETTATEDPTTHALPQTTPETTRIPRETTQIFPSATQTPQTTMDQTTISSPIAPPTTNQIIPLPPPTTSAMDPSTSSSTSPQATTAGTLAETTSVTPPMALHPTLVPSIPISATPYHETSSTTKGTTDSSSASGIPVVLDPSWVGGPSSTDDAGSQPKRSLWLWVIITALVAALASIICIALLVKRRKQKTDHNFGRTSMMGRSQRSKKKKGEEDAWAGPVMIGGVEKEEWDAKEDDGNVVENGGAEEETQVLLSTFTPSEEEKAVGAVGTKEAKKWEEQSPLLYIDEDVEVETPPKEQPMAPSQDGQSAGKTEAEGTEEQKKGEVMGETGGVLNGAVAFCQTTAV